MKWHSAPLGSVAEIQLGKMLSGKAAKGVAPAPYLRNANVQWGRLVLDDLLEMDFSPVERQKFSLVPGDLLVCEGGEPGRCAVVTKSLDGVYYQKALMRVRPHSERLVPEFLQRFMQHAALRGVFRKGGNQSTIAHFPAVRLNALEVPLPPLHEQKRIAAILDAADALRAKRKASIAELDLLMQSTFLEMFGNPVTNPKEWNESVHLGEVADITSGLTKGRKLRNQSTREVPYLAVVNVQDRHLILDPLKIIEATDAEIEKYRLLRNDLLLTEGGDRDKLGRGTLWQGELPECIHQNHIFRVRLHDERLVPVFLNWLVGSDRGKRYFLSQAKQTTGIASINLSQLKRFPLLLPPLHLQQRFASIVEAVESHKVLLKTQHAELESLFASLQLRAFSGELSSKTASRQHVSA
jgi:type I restriction enzyme S subunit